MRHLSMADFNRVRSGRVYRYNPAAIDVYKYTGEDAIDWLEQHVNYAGEDLTWNDLMFIRMERAIERQQQRLREKQKLNGSTVR